ncbi:MAG: hypothetical protein MR292_04120 [Alistipes sp.]|nr:hypothetical protein [Alistipes sp.]
MESGDNTVAVSIAASLPAEMAQTRADGDGTSVNRCIMEIYLDGQLYGERQTVKVDGLKATFSTRLVSGKDYELVFWADHVTSNASDEAITTDLHYNTADLANVTIDDITAYTGNDDTRDAFFGTATLKADYSKTLAVELKRPFGQLKIKTLDMSEVPTDMQPKQVSINFESVHTGIDLFTGELTNVTGGITYSQAADVVDANNGVLSFDYIFAPAGTEQYLTDFTMSFLNDSGAEVVSPYEFSSIPVQRNYRTTVSGNLLTKQADVTIEVKPGFDDDITSDHMDVSAADLQNALDALTEAGKHDYNINVIDNLPAAGNYTLPSLEAGSTLTINLAGAEGEVTFGDSDFAGLFELGSSSANTIAVNINVPKGDAALVSGSWDIKSVSTKPNTFSVNSGATASTINVKGGNVAIYEGATVNSITRDGNNTDETTTVTIFDDATQPTINDEKIKVQEGETGLIMIGEKSFATIADALAAAQPNDVIELAEGKFPLDCTVKASNGQYFYLPIEVEGLTIKGKGDAAKTIVYGNEYTDNGSWGTQNLITVFAENVTLENLTLMPKQAVNKLIEITAPNFSLKNCIAEPNNIVADANATNCGSIYFSQAAANGLIENCTINGGTVSFDGLMAGEFAIRNNIFVEGNSNLVFTTPNWTSNDVTTSTLKVNVENNTFKDFEAFVDGETNPTVRAYYGIFNLTGNTFPTDGIYWQASKFGSIFVNYNSAVDQYWHKDRTEPKSFAISNDKIEFETKTEPNNNWYSWQGRKAAVDMSAKTAWEVTSTLTLTGEDRAVNKSIWLNIGIDWPIVLFKQDENGVRSWKYWDSADTGAWIDVPADKNIPTEAGDYLIKIAFDNGTITHSINGVEIASYELDETSTAVKEIIFNSYSFGDSYKTTWSYPVVK